jgi:hypothetical protein
MPRQSVEPTKARADHAAGKHKRLPRQTCPECRSATAPRFVPRTCDYCSKGPTPALGAVTPFTYQQIWAHAGCFRSALKDLVRAGK